jgi:putative membrane protein
MTLEALLAYAHLLAIFTMVVFLASEAALCRVEWLNAAVVERLGKIDMVYGIAAGTVLLTGLARVFLGSKGAAFYAHNPLLYLKLVMFLVIGLISIKPTLMFVRWRRTLRASGALPDAAEIKKARRLVMVQAHILPFIPLAAVFLARGFGLGPVNPSRHRGNRKTGRRVSALMSFPHQGVGGLHMGAKAFCVEQGIFRPVSP